VQHDAPIKEVFYLDQFNVVATGSWDKTLRYWDGRSPTPVGRVQLPERVYTMDARGAAVIVGTADRQVLIFDVRNPSAPFKVRVLCAGW
jgi:mRNA export factor